MTNQKSPLLRLTIACNLNTKFGTILPIFVCAENSVFFDTPVRFFFVSLQLWCLVPSRHLRSDTNLHQDCVLRIHNLAYNQSLHLGTDCLTLPNTHDHQNTPKNPILGSQANLWVSLLRLHSPLGCSHALPLEFHSLGRKVTQ